MVLGLVVLVFMVWGLGLADKRSQPRRGSGPGKPGIGCIYRYLIIFVSIFFLCF